MTARPCGRSRLEERRDARRFRRDRLVAAGALLVVAVAALTSRTAAVVVGALLAYVLVMAALWAGFARLARGWADLGDRVTAANRRAAEVPEPRSNVQHPPA